MADRKPRFALAQIEVKAGMPEQNVEKMIRFIGEARDRGADLVVFPEMSVGGYLVGDKWLEDSHCRDLMRYNDAILEASRDIAVAWGNIHIDDDLPSRGITGFHPNKDGRIRRYNAIYVAQDGKWARRKIETKYLPPGIHVKSLLPNYRFFDDVRYYFSLLDIALDAGIPLRRLEQPFLIRAAGELMPIGFELCEDLWCEDYRLEGAALNATKLLIANGAELIMNASSSPWTFGKNGARDRRVKFLKSESKSRFVPFLYVNIVGAQNNGKNVITFDGGSTVYNAEGEPILLAAQAYKEELLVIDDFSTPAVARNEAPRIVQKHAALVQGIRHLKDMRGAAEHPRFVIGLSGGVDSAVTAALLVDAVGKDRVFAVNMPTKYNSQRTIHAAAAVAKNLGIRYAELPISDLVEVNRQILAAADLDGTACALSPLDEENVQAKIRGTSILSNLASKYGCVFSNNGNKLEIALGYATLYGDWGGALGVIGDLTKTEVYQLARYFNDGVYRREVIPELLIPDALFRFRPDQIEPSAELKEDQVDPMKFGYHCAVLEVMTDYKKKSAEDLMRSYRSGTLHRELGIDVALMERWGVTRPDEFLRDLEWFARNLHNAVFKRVQAPPIIVTSKSAYGYDIRESILPYRETIEMKRLSKEILALDRYAAAD
jgi:NAD+ synthase (glutamine-hydrolysing)